MSEMCHCGMPAMFAKDPDLPVIFDPDTRDYFISFNSKRKVIMRFCFFCGGKLSLPTDAGFMSPDPDELNHLRELMKDVVDVPSMKKTLGEPDRIFSETAGQIEADKVRAKIYPLRVWIRQNEYNFLYKTINVFVFEEEEGGVFFLCFGKAKPV